jgi:hypothetical protein
MQAGVRSHSRNVRGEGMGRTYRSNGTCVYPRPAASIASPREDLPALGTPAIKTIRGLGPFSRVFRRVNAGVVEEAAAAAAD